MLRGGGGKKAEARASVLERLVVAREALSLTVVFREGIRADE